LKPRVIAVIGDRGVREYQWLRSTANFKGTRYSVQSDPREDAGLAALKVANFRKVAEVPEPIDYAIVAVPRKAAPQVLAECAAAGVATVGFFTAGFSEVGDEIGRSLEAELGKVADASDVAVVGPNCMGLCNPGLGMLNAPPLRPGPPDGDVCFISQSGTHAIGLCMKAPVHGIKVSTAASIGNATVLEAADYLEVMAGDPAIRAIGIYIEGVRDGRRFLSSLKRATARIPVVIWKGGVTAAGARATFSHTGSLATPSAVWKAAMRQSGAVEVINFDAMLDAMELITRARFPVRGRRMGLVAMTGGQSVVISDAFARHGLEVPALSQKSYDEFATFFQVIGGSYRNPLDASWTMGPRGDVNAADRVLDILDRDPVIDAIVMEFRPGPGFGGPPRAEFKDEDMIPPIERLARFNNRASKPFAIAMETGHTHPDMDAGTIVKSIQFARERGLVTLEGFERAAAAFRTAAECSENRARVH
ncbi:MAG: CoA-binding protein, partial [Candidatus Binataceae bacterium]